MIRILTTAGLVLLTTMTLIRCGTMMGAKANPELRSYEEVLELPGHSKDQLYIRANSWFVETFNSAESVIEFQDKEAGKLMGKYIFSYSEGVYTYNVKQTVDVEMKDDKVRVRITNPLYRATSGMGETYYNNSYRLLETQQGVERARSEWKKLTASLESYLEEKDEDW